MRTIGYLRVSTIDQDVSKNENQILKFANAKGFSNVKFVSETVSGSKSWRKRKLADVVDQLSENDVLIVPELSRLGRSLIEVLEVLNILKDKKVKVYSVKENFQLNGSDIQSKVMRTMLGLFAEIERDLIISRTKEGLQAAKAKGAILGRPRGIGKSRLDDHKDDIIKMLKMGVKRNIIANKYSVNPATLLNWLKRHNLNDIKPEMK